MALISRIYYGNEDLFNRSKQNRTDGADDLCKSSAISRYLPNIDEVIRDKMDAIQLFYKDKEENLLCNVCNGKECEFQKTVLRYIYRKNHIVFSAHSAYANNIIPTTLRGLSHFLKLLSTMEDIPEIEFPKDIPEESMAESMASGLKRQLPVLEKI